MKKRVYLLFFILSAAFWLLASACLFYNKYELMPEGMVRTIQKDIQRRQVAVNKLFSNQKLMKHLWLNQLSEQEFRILEEQDFVLHLYEGSELIFWNNNTFPVKENRFIPGITTLDEQGNIFLYQSYAKTLYPGKRLNVVFPVYRHYDVTNEYLKSGFTASESLPSSLRISLKPKRGAYSVQSHDKTTLFYLSDNGATEPLTPGIMILIFIAVALVCTVLSIQMMGIYIVHRYSAAWGIAFVAVTILAVRLFIYWFGLPFNLEYLELFSPHVFASNNFLPSFGHLFFHVLCIYWLLSFAIAQKKKFEHIEWASAAKPFRSWIIFFTTLIILVVFCFYLQHLVQAVVFDSDISFDTNTFNATDKFTFLALIIIAIIARILLLSIQIANAFFEKSVQNKPQKYIALIIVLALMLCLHRYFILNDKPWLSSYNIQSGLDIVAVVWAVIYIRLIDIKYIKNVFAKSGLFSMIFISVYFSMLFALYFKFYIDEKERNINRVAFAEKLSRKQDIELELRFEKIDKNVENDLQLQNWLEGNDTLSIQDVYKHFKVHNSELYFTKYAEDLFLYKSDGSPVIANQKTPLDTLLSLRNRSLPTLNPFLYFNLDNSERWAYLVLLPVRKSSTKELLGYLGINFKIKQNVSQSLYPNLIKSGSETEYKSEAMYNYALYVKGKLINQYGNYNFDYTTPDVRNISFVKRGDMSLLYYRASASKVYVVVYKNNVLVGIVTIFSFLFGLFLLIAAVENWSILLISAWMSGRKMAPIYNTSISVRVKYFTFGFTAVSFFIIGLSTIIFLKNRYQVSSLDVVQQNIANTTDAVSDYLQNEGGFNHYQNVQEQIAGSGFVFFLTNLSQQQKMDINIFDTAGRLAFTTQDNIYESKVLDNMMSASAFQIMRKKKLSSFIQPEKVGSLEYTASYSPIIHENKLIGYLNIPSFYIKQKLDSQIVSLITTLVNIYTILLLISSIITFLFINTLTKSLRMVADSLKNVSLTNNTLINWPYKDEIGLLIHEYNKMVETVEKNARSLVLDERQSAWREMAQQVAHEIKNPLTPMKLNIQYLQQAINSNHPDIINLTRRVSSSIIEQIDNLNYIASEFSNFAKMPENKTERIELKGMLERIVLLFSGNKNLKVTHEFPEEPVEVYADKSQMLRIFTNIVQNAVESIPTDLREGLVEIQLFLEEGKGAVVKVKDNGTGIPDDVKDKIFDPYFTTKSSGTGLGLAMTKKIIELWGGNIRFESVPDEGTTFILIIPMA